MHTWNQNAKPCNLTIKNSCNLISVFPQTYSVSCPPFFPMPARSCELMICSYSFHLLIIYCNHYTHNDLPMFWLSKYVQILPKTLSNAWDMVCMIHLVVYMQMMDLTWFDWPKYCHQVGTASLPNWMLYLAGPCFCRIWMCQTLCCICNNGCFCLTSSKIYIAKHGNGLHHLLIIQSIIGPMTGSWLAHENTNCPCMLKLELHIREKHGTWKDPLGKGETSTNHQFLDSMFVSGVYLSMVAILFFHKIRQPSVIKNHWCETGHVTERSSPYSILTPCNICERLKNCGIMPSYCHHAGLKWHHDK